jgi:hypothetical protein
LEASSPKETQFPPLRGRIGVKSSFLEYERYTWRPLSIEITFPPNVVGITITDATLCGISTTGVVKITSAGIGLDFHPLAEDQELSSSVACLLGKPQPVSGSLNLDGRIKGQGQAKDLVSSLQGPWQLEAKDGRLYRESLIIQILGFLGLSELFEKDKKDLSKRELSFKTIQAKGDLQSSKVFIRELGINTPGMQLFSQGKVVIVNRHIDLVVAIAPLKTVDWLVSHMPVVGYVLGGTLVSIPVRVKGSLNDPRIIPLDPAEIGSEFLGGMKRILRVPFKFIKPIFKVLEKREK